MKKRIWELDFFRGIFLWGMIGIHLIYDLVDLYGVIAWEQPPAYLLFKNRFGILFLLLSGLCATLGSRSLRRGIQVFACGMVVSLATALMVWAGFAGKDLMIYFGVLHCLGTCMILWTLFKKLPTPVLLVLGLAMAVYGEYLRNVCYPWADWLFPLGFKGYGFASSDYFPLLPNLGYFLLGSVLGRLLYREKQTLLPRVNADNPVIRFFRFCGEHSLLIYMLHQPILAAAVGLIAML